jgi:hypothetical protein
MTGGGDADQEDAFWRGGEVEGEVLAGVGGEVAAAEESAVEGGDPEAHGLGGGIVEMDGGGVDDGIGVAREEFSGVGKEMTVIFPVKIRI